MEKIEEIETQSKNEEEIIHIPILYQDDEIIIVNKPAFMMVHPWRGGPRKEKALMTWLKEQTGHWVYPVHRLDRQSSGAVLFALKSSHVTFFKDRWHSEVEKKYLLLCMGIVEDEGEFKNQLRTNRGHKQDAHTIYTPLAWWNDHPDFRATFCEAKILTGRKHQIRRHFSRHIHPLIGDSRYGKGPINDYFRHEKDFKRLFLHSHFLKIPHPTKNEMIAVQAPIFPEMENLIQNLGLKSKEGEPYTYNM